MAKIEKPITDNMKDKANLVFKCLKLAYPKYATKEDIMKFTGITSERVCRDVINTLRKRVPVLSNSTNKGYKLARSEKDLDEVVHCWMEIDSRIEDLEQNKIALINFYNQYRR